MHYTLRTLPLAQRVLFTCYLLMIGLGYLAAILFLYYVDVEPHATAGDGLISGIADKYHGVPTRLETALRGPMADRATPEDKQKVFKWIKNGAKEETFATEAKPVIQANCVRCHNPTSGVKRPNGEPLPSLETFQDIVDADLITIDTGLTFAQLARVSHIHLFGISILVFISGFIISMSETPMWFRVLLIATPYAAIFSDIGAWWLAKWEALFSWFVVIGGAAMGLALAIQILLAIWEMWLASSTQSQRPSGQ